MIDLNQPIINLSRRDQFKIRDLAESLIGLGQTGSGKSSSLLFLLAMALMRIKAGVIILVAKAEEVPFWKKIAAENGRADDVIEFGPGGHTFNPLAWQVAADKRIGQRPTRNLVDLIEACGAAINRKRETGGDNEGPFWAKQPPRYLSFAIDLLYLAGEVISFDAIHRLINSAPTSPGQVDDADWRSRSYFNQVLEKGAARTAEMTEDDRHDFEVTARFFCQDFAEENPKVRSTVLSMVNEPLEQFVRGSLRRPFSTTTSFVPELVHYGAIAIVNWPILATGVEGAIVAALMKHCFQQSVMRSPDRTDPNARLAVLVSDECQFTLDPERDTKYLSVARGYKAPMIYLTQSKTMLDAVAGEKAENQVKACLSNFTTRVFLANGDEATQEYAQNLFGKALQWRRNVSEGSSTNEATPAWLGGGDTENAGMSQQMDYVVQGSELADLRTGGPDNDFEVDALVYKAGRRWKASGQFVLRCTFPQPVS